MKKFYFVFLATALLAASCQKEFGSGNDKPEVGGTIPAEFDWKMTQDVTVSVDVPVVDGAAPAYAVVRVYSSPDLSTGNLLAKGAVKVGMPYRTTVTVPSGAKNIYVETTLPDGMKSVKMVAAHSSVTVSGMEMKSFAASQPKIRVAGVKTRSSMPAFVEIDKLDKEADFLAGAIIRQTPGSMYDLGASYAPATTDKYLIPVGSEVTGNIDMNGNRSSTYAHPILYVAGKLTMSSLNIGNATLAVLPGGEVNISSLRAQPLKSDLPTIYVFEGGKLTTSYPNLSCNSVVNMGAVVVNGDLDLNNELKFYNTASASLTLNDLKLSGAVVYNDGVATFEGLKLNSQAEFNNYEGGVLTVADVCEFENKTTILQAGKATFHDVTARGTMLVNCYTTADFMWASQADIRMGAGAGLEVKTSEFNNTDVSMAGNSIFVTENYNVEQTGGKNNFMLASGSDAWAVVVIKEKAYVSQGHDTNFSGLIEVVYDNSDSDFYIGRKYLTEGAVVRAQQSVVIPSTPCNGGKEPVKPTPEPEPEEYELAEGATYTYCFEDLWPYVGDYDMNDLVVATSIDRMISKDGKKVKSLVINWEAKAAGTTFPLAFAVQMDAVASSQVQTRSTFTGFGSNGIFAAQGLEAGNEKAVIAFFNDSEEVLAGNNTWPGFPVPTTRYATTVEFSEPVAVETVVESKMNFFIVKQERSLEIHLPGYAGTKFAANLNKDSKDPYKFYVTSGEHVKDNNMMWGLMIPGEFRYPQESKDIRTVYTYFLDWAVSSGAQHEEWYNEEADASKLF